MGTCGGGSEVALLDRILKRETPHVAVKGVVAAQPASQQLVDAFEELYSLGRVLQPPYDPLRLLVLAETNEVHSAALHAVATDAVGRGWKFAARHDEADPEERDAAASLLNELSPQYTFAELLYQAAWELLAVGWSAWEVVRDDAGRVAAIYPMPAHTLRLSRDPDVFVQHRGGRFRYFKRFGVEAALDPLTGQWAEAEQDASEVIYFSRYSPRTRYGVPHWISCLAAIAEYAAIRDYSIAFFESSGTVGRMLLVQTQSPEAAQRYVDEITQELQNAVTRYHSTLVLGLPAQVQTKVEQLNPDVREGSFLRRREELIKAILMAHNVPPYRVGWAVLGSLGGSAAREMLRAYRLGVVEPLQTILESRLAKTLFGPRGLALRDWEWRLEDLDWEETELSLEVAIRAVNAGLLSPNEGRVKLGLEPVEDPAMDAYYYQGTPVAEPQVRQAVDVIKELRDALRVAVQDVSAGA